MQEEGFVVKFIGDESSLEKASQQATSALNKVSKSTVATNQALNSVTVASNKTAQATTALAKTQAVGAAAATKSGKDFTGLSRVLQDLPFGLVAIQNNITQLLPAAGGLGLAVSAITAAVTFATVGFGAWTRGFDSASEAAEKHVNKVQEARKALETFVQSLEDVRQARVVGQQNAQQELVSLKTLYDATQNANIPLAKRRELVDQLQEQYPKYFANIKDETILAGGAKVAYDRLAASILAAARARAAQDALVDIQKDLLAVEEKQTKNFQGQYDAQQKLGRLQSQGLNKNAAAITVGQAASANVLQNAQALNDAQSEYNARVKNSSELNKQRNDLLDRAKRLTGEITDITVENPDALLDAGAKIKELKVKVEKVKISRIESIEFDRPEDFFKGLLPETFNPNKDFSKLVADTLSKITAVAPTFHFPTIKINAEEFINFIRIEEAKAKWASTLMELGKSATTAAQSVATDAFAAFGEAIGTALAGGDITNVFKALFSTIGGAIANLGKQMIALSPLIQSIQIAIKSLNPALLLPAGIAMVALGSVIKASFANIKGFATGGLVFGPTLGMVGEGKGTSRSNPEVIAPLNKLQNFIGGGSNINVPEFVEVRIHGDQLVGMLRMAEKARGRDR